MRRILFILLLTLSLHTSAQEQQVRLLYWNVQNGMWDGQGDDYRRFTDWVAQQAPDICVWCEAMKLYKTGTNKRSKEGKKKCIARWQRLAQRYGHQYVYLSACHDNYPQLITSRYPLTEQRLITGNNDTIVSHGAGWFTAQIGTQTINIVTLHAWPKMWAPGISKSERQKSADDHQGDKHRQKEVEYICKHTILTHPQAEDEYWMMMGDFNALSSLDKDTYNKDSLDVAFLSHNYILGNTPYRDVIKHSYPDEFVPSAGYDKRRIDYVYLTPRLQSKVKKAFMAWDEFSAPRRDILQQSNFYHPSDHLPIIVDFEL